MHDPFETLGLEPAFDLDLTQAEKRHRELSKTFHPDRHAGKPAAERREALGKAIEVNQAWRALRDPISRGEALLARLGVVVEGGGEPKPDPGLLMEMMDKREELAAVGQRRDAAALSALILAVKTRESQLLSALGAQFHAVLAKENRSARAAAEPILRGLGELRYYRRFLDEAAVVEDEVL